MNLPDMLVARPDFESSLGCIAAEIERRTGLGNWASRGNFLTDKIRQRTRALGLAAETDYFERLLQRGDAAEWEALIEAITIGETSFWRYAAQWQALRDMILPEIARRRPGKRIRVWCAGSSNGAEPYTLSILLRHDAPRNIELGRVDILATDISRARLAQAARGLYSDWDLRSLARPLRDACFIPDGSRWRLREQYKRGVEFRQHNLIEFAGGANPAERDGFDVIMCRNVLIYFEAELVRRLLRQFHSCVADDGWFLTGHAESYLEIANVFVPVAAPGTTLYRKQAVTRGTPVTAAVLPAAVRPSQSGIAPPAARTGPGEPRPKRRQSIPPDSARPHGRPSRTEPLPATPAPGTDMLRALASRGEWREAAQLGASLAEEDGFDPEVHFLVSLSCAHMGDPEGADAALRRALYLDPDFALAHYHLGMVATSRQRKAEAARCFRNVLASLRHLDDDVPVRAGDGVSAGDLRQYACLQLGEHPEADG